VWQRICQRSAEISHPLSRGRNLIGKHDTTLLATPLFIPEEEDLILLNWAAEVEAVVIIFQLRLRLAGPVEKEVGGI